jgi:RNA ligase (TIGR02306 family)
MKNLATIQIIKSIKPHPNADKLELATVLGWQVVVKKGEFKPGNLCVYVVTDTVMPDLPEFEFLKSKNFRIKPIRLRGESSNGICFPLSVLQSSFVTPLESNDVTDQMGVIHYEKPLPAQLAGNAVGRIPNFIIITDEDNLRSYPHALAELYGKEYYITRKDDGSSCTFFKTSGPPLDSLDETFGVCSRKINLQKDENNGFWKMAIKYDIERKLTEFMKDVDISKIAIQGELVGPNVQKNPLGLENLEFHAFGLLHIPLRKYYPFSVLREFCNKFEVPMVHVIEHGASFNYSLEELIGIANNLKYPNNTPAEGIVIRPTFEMHSQVLNKQWSGKVISEHYED